MSIRGDRSLTGIINQPVLSFRLTALLLMLISSGCTTMDLKSFTMFEEKPEFKTPLQVIPVWSDTVLHQAGKTGTRGFGGRVIFYGENKEKSIRVDGTLVVYAWDDTEDAANRQADRKYVFKADKLQDHYSNSKIGHSYNFWLPWDAAGGEQERISLIIRFIGVNGAEVNSEPTTVVLPGPIKKPKSMLAKQGNSRIHLTQSKAIRENIENSHLLPATHKAYTNEAIVEQSRYPIQQTEYVRYREQIPHERSHDLQTSEISLPNSFVERNMQGSDIGFSSEDLFAPEENNTRYSGVSGGNPRQRYNTRQQRSHSEEAESATQSSTHSQPFQSRVRTARSTPQFRGHVRRKPLLAKSLNALPQTPRSESRAAQ